MQVVSAFFEAGGWLQTPADRVGGGGGGEGRGQEGEGVKRAVRQVDRWDWCLSRTREQGHCVLCAGGSGEHKIQDARERRAGGEREGLKGQEGAVGGNWGQLGADGCGCVQQGAAWCSRLGNRVPAVALHSTAGGITYLTSTNLMWAVPVGVVEVHGDSLAEASLLPAGLAGLTFHPRHHAVLGQSQAGAETAHPAASNGRAGFRDMRGCPIAPCVTRPSAAPPPHNPRPLCPRSSPDRGGQAERRRPVCPREGHRPAPPPPRPPQSCHPPQRSPRARADARASLCMSVLSCPLCQTRRSSKQSHSEATASGTLPIRVPCSCHIPCSCTPSGQDLVSSGTQSFSPRP